MYQSAHEQFVRRMHLNVYDYDPAEDGPEVGVINMIYSTHHLWELAIEQMGKTMRGWHQRLS